MLRQSSTILPIRAVRPGLTEITEKVCEFVADSGIQHGLLTLVLPAHIRLPADPGKCGACGQARPRGLFRPDRA
jgi:hypothetical protein